MVKTITKARDLVAAGLLAPALENNVDALSTRYAIAITPELAQLIDPTNPFDPISAQFVPSLQELVTTPHEMADPIDDAGHSPLPGLVHRYRDRVLLKVVSVCPVYCRFCFRREMVGPGGDALGGAALDDALAYIAAKPEIFEVILTGGDPFMLSVRRIKDLMSRLAKIGHVKIVRWHTRVPVVDSARITPAFVAALRHDGLTTYVAIHANHAREFTPAACTALARLVDAGVVLVSQSVLLKGVNDTLEALSDLMRAFVVNRVKPYYLHHPDLAPGTSHFRPSIAQGQALMRDLRKRLSGLAQPLYVLDVPGGAIKAPLSGDYVKAGESGMLVLSGEGSWLDYKG